MTYEVERLIGKIQLPGEQPYFLVQWKGYPIEESTWEPFKNLNNLSNEMFRLVDGQLALTEDEYETVRELTLQFIRCHEQNKRKKAPVKPPSDEPEEDEAMQAPPEPRKKGPQIKKVQFVQHPKMAAKRKGSQMKIRRRFMESDSSSDEDFYSLY